MNLIAHNTVSRNPGALAKVERLKRALRHEEPDRVPISDFFWGDFKRRWREELGLPEDADPYTYYDLDFVVTIPNMDPWIRPFETIRESDAAVVVKTGYGTTMRKRFDLPMPEMMAWDVDTFSKLEAVQFDDPRDRRRFFDAGDNQIAGVGDGFERNSPPWIETLESHWKDFAVLGSMGEVSECLTRLIGQENALIWMAEYPERMGAVINRIGEHYLECAKAAMDAGEGWLDGFVIWGDVAYKRSTFMSPRYWREYFKPWVSRMVEYAHQCGLVVIYHGCGNVKAILPDFIEIGIDGYNPLEAKAGLDVVELRRRYGHQIGFCGNSDIQVWETGDPIRIRREVLRKLNAARGGGYVFMSDHSVSSSVSGHTYDTIVELVREYGCYPLRLGQFELAEIEA
jgi:hypothetical protein